MPFRPRFNKYFFGDWNYSHSDGVGIKLTGYPDDLDKFIELLHEESCNPIATRRILEELKQNNVKYTTLMSNLNFDYIGDELNKIGVKMEVIPPVNPDKIQNQSLDNYAFEIFIGKKELTSIDVNEKDKIEIQKRLEVFKNSFKQHESDFGPYDPNPQKASQAIDKLKRKKLY